MTSRLCLRISAGLLFALAASGANAGGPITAQQLSLSLKSVSQTDTNSGDQKPGKHTANTKEVFEACMGNSTPPTKTQGIYLFLDCNALNVGTDPVTGTILAIDTAVLPPTALATVGTLTIHTDFGVLTTKSGGAKPTSVTVPVEVAIDCNASATTAELVGVMTMKLSLLGVSDFCPDSGSIKLLGAGNTEDLVTMNPIDFIVDNGSTIGVKKRSADITAIPLF
jgi:hypothetical protein